MSPLVLDKSSSRKEAFSRRVLQDLKVLVVDDEDDARELLREVLRRQGCRVTTAASVSEALACFDNERPDVLVSDIGMPEEDGYSLMRRVRALDESAGGGVPAIAVTAYATSADRERAFQAGFRAHLPKPLATGKLLAALESLVEEGGGPAEPVAPRAR